MILHCNLGPPEAIKVVRLMLSGDGLNCDSPRVVLRERPDHGHSAPHGNSWRTGAGLGFSGSHWPMMTAHGAGGRSLLTAKFSQKSPSQLETTTNSDYRPHLRILNSRIYQISIGSVILNFQGPNPALPYHLRPDQTSPTPGYSHTPRFSLHSYSTLPSVYPVTGRILPDIQTRHDTPWFYRTTHNSPLPQPGAQLQKETPVS